MLNIFSCGFWPFVLAFEKALFSSFGHFFITSLILWDFSLLSPYIFWLLIPFRCTANKDFLPFCGLPVQSGDQFFCCAEVSCNAICQSFHLVAETLGYYLGSYCFCL
jgi:hypothetical protein